MPFRFLTPFTVTIHILEIEERVHQSIGVALKLLPGSKADVAGESWCSIVFDFRLVIVVLLDTGACRWGYRLCPCRCPPTGR